MDMLNLGILVVDQEGRIAFANRAADKLLQDHIGRPDCSRADLVRGAESLHRKLSSAIARSERDKGSHVSVLTASDEPLIVLRVTFAGGGPTAATGSVAVLFISNPNAEPDVDLRAIARLYGLTRAETRLLRALLRGRRVSECAVEAGITLNTAKGYLKQLFSKTRTRSQSDLVRTILANPVLHLVSTQTDSKPD